MLDTRYWITKMIAFHSYRTGIQGTSSLRLAGPPEAGEAPHKFTPPDKFGIFDMPGVHKLIERSAYVPAHHSVRQISRP